MHAGIPDDEEITVEHTVDAPPVFKHVEMPIKVPEIPIEGNYFLT